MIASRKVGFYLSLAQHNPGGNPVFGRWRQEDKRFKVIFDYIVCLIKAWGT